MKRKKTARKKLEDKLEKLVKDYVKDRDNYTCQKCGKYLEKSNCHASHVIPVSAGNQFKYDPLNMKVLCFHDHIHWWHKNPIEAGDWFKKKFPDRHKYLFGQPRKTVKLTEEKLKQMIETIKIIILNF
jgi:5-methylcytosine-specific restriction endonuclease McrA